MTFSLADFPMIDAREVTVALGFKGAPVIRLLDTSRGPQAEDPTRVDYFFCLNNKLKIFRFDVLDPKQPPPNTRPIIAAYLAQIASNMACGSSALFLDYLQEITENLSKSLGVDKDTLPICITIRDIDKKKLFTFVSNYPTYPLEWCKPATQRLVCLENKEDTSGSRPALLPESAHFASQSSSAVTGQTGTVSTSGHGGNSRIKALIEGPDTDLPPRKWANTEPSPISENRTGQPMEANTIPQLDRLSFELSITAPDSKDSLVIFNNMNFRDSLSTKAVFDNGRSPSSDVLDSPEFVKFNTDFLEAISNMDEDDELWVRVKLEKPSDSTKNQNTGPSPDEPPLEHEDTHNLLDELPLANLSITEKPFNTNPKSE
ncbi:hypothetical protein [Endozoicomonas sp. SESOKO1]|uniref:hypothetical protein n=1 Tax=Endozoicomonas sp. SESOKO1 TaxID=2828742 RepID=UPI0021498DE5|nr:hypothetical protein [Endozoicomonas sp. SESOKO1]